jgi:hypothetical protein
MTGMSVVGGNSPVGTDMMEKNRFVILFNTTGRKRSVSKDLKKASVIRKEKKTVYLVSSSKKRGNRKNTKSIR